MHLRLRAALFRQTAAAWWNLDVPEPVVVEFLVPPDRRQLDNSPRIHTTVSSRRCEHDTGGSNGDRPLRAGSLVDVEELLDRLQLASGGGGHDGDGGDAGRVPRRDAVTDLVGAP
jgi:hypothetical protein